MDDNNDWKSIENVNTCTPQDHIKSSVFAGQPAQTIDECACSIQPVKTAKQSMQWCSYRYTIYHMYVFTYAVLTHQLIAATDEKTFIWLSS